MPLPFVEILDDERRQGEKQAIEHCQSPLAEGHNQPYTYPAVTVANRIRRGVE